MTIDMPQDYTKPTHWHLVYNCTLGRAVKAVSAVFFAPLLSEIATLRATLALSQAQKQQSDKIRAELGFSDVELDCICKLMR